MRKKQQQIFVLMVTCERDLNFYELAIELTKKKLFPKFMIFITQAASNLRLRQHCMDLKRANACLHI